MDLIKFCNKIITFSFYAIFFLVPIVFVGSTSELFEFNKMWVTFAFTIVIMTAWLSKMIMEKQFRVQKTPLDWFLIAFLISQVISSFLSLDNHVSLWGYYSRFNGGLLSMLCYVLLYYAFVTHFSRRDDEQTNEFSLPVRIIFFICGISLPLITVYFASPITDAKTWVTFLLLFVRLIS